MMFKSLIVTGFAVSLACGVNVLPAVSAPPEKPNILFVIMDDVGIDQMAQFGYGGSVAPAKTPVIDAIAAAGVKFRNNWSTPECSPSRVSFFTGRHPLRHRVMAALLPPDQAISQMSPFETTTPNILRTAGYKSALLGKSHFTNSLTDNQDPSTDPYQGTPVVQLGWDYHKGWFDAAPYSIDTTAGGVAAKGTYNCGFVPVKAVDQQHGADRGTCYKPDGSCTVMTKAGVGQPGLVCLTEGGILKPNVDDPSCSLPPAPTAFEEQNGYYVGQLLENPGRGLPPIVKSPSDAASRGYRTKLEADFTIDWIKAQTSASPWMATLAFSSAHTPWQPAPRSLTYTKTTGLGNDCGGKDGSLGPIIIRQLMTQMIEAMDKELGRVLVETGLATRKLDGSIKYDPRKTNTVIVVVSDNGSFAGDVRLPFDPSLSKGTVYQTGVWVPLIIAGPMVVSPNRTVESMTNNVDLFSFFGEVAGVDVRKHVPSTHGLDSKPLLPYLLNPDQDKASPPIRSDNFAQYQPNTRSTSFVTGTCVIKSVNTCITLMPFASACTDNGGTWYGKGTSEDIPEPYKSANGFTQCCQVNQWIKQYSPVDAEGNPVQLVDQQSDYSYAMRNRLYKLIRKSITDYDPAIPDADQLASSCKTTVSDEFYQINQRPVTPKIERPDRNNLLPKGTQPGKGAAALTDPVLKSNYTELDKKLDATLSSYADCPGDVNLDGQVNSRDVADQSQWRKITNGTSTWWDMDINGYTNQADKIALQSAIGSCQLKAGQTR